MNSQVKENLKKVCTAQGSFILRPPKLVRMRVRVRIRVHVTGEVLARGLTYVGRLSEQPHWRWPNQGAAVAKQGGLAS